MPPPPLGGADEGEFDAMAHGVDAFGADADFIAEVPLKLAGLGAAASERAFRGVATVAATKRGGSLAAG